MRQTRLMFAVATAALLTACTSENNMPPPDNGVTALYVNVLDCGTLEVSDFDAFSSAGDYAGTEGTLTNTCYLVNHPKGRLLWDLGLPTSLRLSGPVTQDIFTVSLTSTLAEQLAKLNLPPSAIEYVSISHAHFDHVGQADQMTASTWLVHQVERDMMIPPDGTPPQVPPDLAGLYAPFHAMKSETFTGEMDVFGDGSVVIFETPGHTPGHTSLQLNLPETGPVLLTGDLYHRVQSRNFARVPRFNYDEAMTRASMEAFEARARELGAKVIIQHERSDIEPLEGILR